MFISKGPLSDFNQETFIGRTDVRVCSSLQDLPYHLRSANLLLHRHEGKKVPRNFHKKQSHFYFGKRISLFLADSALLSNVRIRIFI